MPRTDTLSKALLAQGMEVRLPTCGSSMYPVIAPGDRVTVAGLGGLEPVEGDILLVAREGRLWCHRLVRAEGVGGRRRSSGTGYIPDIAEAVSILDEEGPFFTCVADLPCITPRIIGKIEDRYRESGKEACSVWVPQSIGGRETYADEVEGVMACPARINILMGDAIDRPQEELRLLISDRRLAFNINTREELAAVKSLLGDR